MTFMKTCSRIRRRAGFTLVELLVTVTIILVLATMAFMGSSAFMKRAAATQDMATKKNIWAGIALYASDNNDLLPGPLFSGQRAIYGAKSTGRVSHFIAPYLGYDAPATGEFFETMGASWQKSDAAKSAPCYLFRLNTPTGVGTATVAPWGNANNKPNLQPLRLSATLSRIDSSRTWALTDVDQQHPEVGSAAWRNEVPTTMSHGDHRLALYFDGSGGKVDINNMPR